MMPLCDPPIRRASLCLVDLEWRSMRFEKGRNFSEFPGPGSVGYRCERRRTGNDGSFPSFFEMHKREVDVASE